MQGLDERLLGGEGVDDRLHGPRVDPLAGQETREEVEDRSVTISGGRCLKWEERKQGSVDVADLLQLVAPRPPGSSTRPRSGPLR